jgi:hypothetical protein
MKKQFSNNMVPRKKAAKKLVNPTLTWPLSGIVVTMEE